MVKANTHSEERKGKVKREARVHCQVAGGESGGEEETFAEDARCKDVSEVGVGYPSGQRLVWQAESCSPAALDLAG